MAIFRDIRRIARRHVAAHLLIPLLGGFVGEAAAFLVLAFFSSKATDWVALKRYLLSAERIGLIIGALIAYSLVMYFIIRKETNTGMRRLNLSLAVLEDALDGATSYFALAAIRLKEWFDPSVQAYLATINRQRGAGVSFRHDRILFFFTSSDFKDLESDNLDGYYAKALVCLHRKYDIRLGFLRRRDIFEILNHLTVDDKRYLHCYRWPNSWLSTIASPDKGWSAHFRKTASNNPPVKRWLSKMALIAIYPIDGLSRLSLKIPRRRIRQLAFAVIEYPDDRRGVLLFEKHGQIVNLEVLADRDIQPYCRLAELIKEKVFESTPAWPNSVLRPDHDFLSLIS